jgi:hypothetical protein
MTTALKRGWLTCHETEIFAARVMAADRDIARV